MPAQTSRRQPLSCEPCRKRKIRCSRDRTPCEACVRRGYSQSCVYVRQDLLGNTHSHDCSSSSEELIERIRSLEALLHQHIGSSSPSAALGQSNLSPTALPSAGSIPERSPPELTPTRSPPLLPQIPGVLRSTQSGYQQYEPRLSQWKSVVPNATLDAIGDVNVHANHEITGFPFEGNAVLDRKILLASLPPARQCDELLEVYFRVFSPVRCMTSDRLCLTSIVDALT
jgi:hypothetical protein